MIDERSPDYSNTPVSPRRPLYGYAPATSDDAAAVSLITPFYNAGSLFRETATSVFQQSLQQWEWIIVDDASDCAESVGILNEYARRDSRIRVVWSSQRRGPAAARNAGVAAATTPYVAFLDSDDLLEPTALEKWRWFLECHPQYCMVKGFQAGFGATKYIWRDGFHSGSAILKSNLIQTASMMRRETYLAVGGMDETILGGMEDWEFWLRCADAGYWGGTVPEVLDWYRRRASHNDRWRDWDSSHRQEAFSNELRRRYPRLFAGRFPEPEQQFLAPHEELPPRSGFENRLRLEDGQQRLLVVTPHLALGGSDKFTLDLISQLALRHSYKVTVATTLSAKHEWRHRYESLTPDVFTLDSFLTLRYYPGFLAYLIRSRGIDSVLITHSQLGYQLLPYLRSQCPQIRCYDYVHIEEPQWKSGGYPAYSIAYRSFLERTVASSEHLKQWMTEHGGESEKISVVTTNIEASQWRREPREAEVLRRRWDVPPDTPVVLFAARICEQKQPHVLAATLDALHQRAVRFQCIVAGDGEQSSWLRGFVERRGLSEVRLLGARSNEEIRELLAISDVFFLPSRQEGISLALYEAMAMEVVPVAADVGGQSELVVPSCGILVRPDHDQVNAYVDALCSLLTDEARRMAMAKAARQRIATYFTLDEMGSEMARILRGALDGPSFDLAQALQAFVPEYAREVIEQRRIEVTADQLWHERCLTVAGAAGFARYSRLAGVRQSILRVLGVLYPVIIGDVHRRNRELFWRILGRTATRRRLLAAFDRDFYCAMNGDVPRFGPLPLLHYIFCGYREGRLPSPDFDAVRLTNSQIDSAAGGTNPLLWKMFLSKQMGPPREESL